jgi:hypothetical protein
MKVCKRSKCKNKVHGHGLCSSHYDKKRRKQDPDRNNQKQYEKTPKGFLMRLYRNMYARVSGLQKNRAHLYVGKCLLDKQDFYSWAENHPRFLNLFTSYQLSGYSRKQAPSVDRINPDIGYKLSNMEWVTQSENSRRAAVTKKRLGD